MRPASSYQSASISRANPNPRREPIRFPTRQTRITTGCSHEPVRSKIGNYHFNTIGNLTLNPKAGHLFIDFDSGDLLYMTGETEVIWDNEEVKAFVGAERIVRFHIDELIRVETSLPIRWRFEEYSPILDRTGSWEQAVETITADKERNAYQVTVRNISRSVCLASYLSAAAISNAPSITRLS